MCGRYSLAVNIGTLKERFHLTARDTPLAKRYNIAPSQDAPVIAAADGKRTLELMRWGLVPFWAKDPAIGNRLINARADTAPEKPAFRASFERRRCLVPADGFYEWDKKTRVPVRYVLKSRKPFAFAGLWDLWDKDPGRGSIRSFTILTTDANSLVRAVHPRMPVVLRPELEGAWLEGASPAELRRMLAPCDPGDWEGFPVSRLLNSPVNEGPALVEPAREPQPELFRG